MNPPTTLHYAIGTSTLSQVLVAAANDRGICALLLGDQPDALRAELAMAFPNAALTRDDTALTSQLAQAIALADAPSGCFDGALDIGGSPFQQEVWQALRDIPPGTTATYTEIARRIGRPEAVRAVATACAANLLAIVIPCHRVVRADGGLAGYRWGIARKRALLSMELGA